MTTSTGWEGSTPKGFSSLTSPPPSATPPPSEPPSSSPPPPPVAQAARAPAPTPAPAIARKRRRDAARRSRGVSGRFVLSLGVSMGSLSSLKGAGSPCRARTRGCRGPHATPQYVQNPTESVPGASRFHIPGQNLHVGARRRPVRGSRERRPPGTFTSTPPCSGIAPGALRRIRIRGATVTPMSQSPYARQSPSASSPLTARLYDLEYPRSLGVYSTYQEVQSVV